MTRTGAVAPLTLHPDRLLPSEPGVLAIARRLYEAVRELPLICPHGHVDPRLRRRGQVFFVPPAVSADELRTPSPQAWTQRWTVVTEQPRWVAISRRL